MKTNNFTVCITLLFLILFYSLGWGATVDVKVKDLNHDNLVSASDQVDKVYENGFFETCSLSKANVRQVTLSAFDVNNDDKIQLQEYQNYLDHETNLSNKVTIISSTKEKVKMTIYDGNHNGYVDVNEIYQITSTSGKKEYGKMSSSILFEVTNNNYDKDNKITTLELINYLNSLGHSYWSIELLNIFPVKPSYDVYTVITDTNKNNCVDIGETYIHYSFDANNEITFREKSIITQGHLDAVLNGFDTNNDGKVQKEEFEAATFTLLHKTCLLIFAPPIINTPDYWPTLIDNVWEYQNKIDSTKISWTQIVPGHIFGRSIDAFFSKNSSQTYWGYPNDMAYRMGLFWNFDKNDSLDEPNLAASSSRSYTNAFDNNADAMVYWSNANPLAKSKYADYWNVKTESCKGNVPYVIFPVKLDVDNYKVDSQQGQFHINWDAVGNSEKTEEYGHPWKISYEWFYLKTDIGYEGLALRLSCDELFAVPSVFEDWYFVEGLGVVRIEQYNQHERTSRIIQINASKIILN